LQTHLHHRHRHRKAHYWNPSLHYFLGMGLQKGYYLIHQKPQFYFPHLIHHLLQKQFLNHRHHHLQQR
jgi:hypothetical protein